MPCLHFDQSRNDWYFLAKYFSHREGSLYLDVFKLFAYFSMLFATGAVLRQEKDIMQRRKSISYVSGFF